MLQQQKRRNGSTVVYIRRHQYKQYNANCPNGVGWKAIDAHSDGFRACAVLYANNVEIRVMRLGLVTCFGPMLPWAQQSIDSLGRFGVPVAGS